jgi:hypothetical protein
MWSIYHSFVPSVVDATTPSQEDHIGRAAELDPSAAGNSPVKAANDDTFKIGDSSAYRSRMLPMLTTNIKAR